MKRIKTRALALLLSCCLVTIGTVGSYQTAHAAEIVAGGAIVGTLEEILLSFGIFLLPSAMTDQAQSSDWWYSEDGNAALKPYYDDLASEYEKERFKVINGGGGNPQPSPTPVPEQKPEIQPTPAPEVKPGDIPTFEELVAPALAGGAITWATGAWDTMAKAVSNFWNKCFGRANGVSEGVPEDQVNNILSSGLPYYVYCYSWNKIHLLSLGGYGSYIVRGNVFFDSGYKNYENGILMREAYQCSGSSFYNDSNFSNWSSNLPVFDSESDAKEWANSQKNNAKKFTKENIWVHPDLQETYQNNGKLEYPQQAPRPLQYPTAENLADLAKKLNPEINPNFTPEIAPNYVKELITQLQKDPSVNPDPNPNPNPNPDPGTKPQPTAPPDKPENPEDEVKPYTAL